MRYQSLLSGIAFVAVAVAGCESTSTGPTQPLEALPRSLSASEQAIIEASNGFAFQLLRRVNEGDESENVFISPLSVSMALGMTMNGAAGESFSDMRDALGFQGLTQEEINESYSSLMKLLLELDPSVEISVANSVWYRDGFRVESSFLDAVKASFEARVDSLDFGNPQSVDYINDWVGDNTRGKIDTIIESIPPDAMMYLINAVYFKGNWADEFDKSRTTSDTFRVLNGSQAAVKMMRNMGRYGYASTSTYEAIEMPYGNGAFTMTVLMPPTGGNVNEFLATLENGGFETMVGSFASGEVGVELPRFKLEYEKSLNEALIAMGMENPFADGAADFTRMSAQQGHELYISDVKHKTFVDVNEEGTEAAAATSVEIGVVSLPPTIRIDRPFVFVIREKFSGTVLFVGKIVNPNEVLSFVIH